MKTLIGLNGKTMLGYLAALGTARLLGTKLGWQEDGPFWRPVLATNLTEENIAHQLLQHIQTRTSSALDQACRNQTQNAVQAKKQKKKRVKDEQSPSVDILPFTVDRYIELAQNAHGDLACQITALTHPGCPDSKLESFLAKSELPLLNGTGSHYHLRDLMEILDNLTKNPDRISKTLFSIWDRQDDVDLRFEPSSKNRQPSRLTNVVADIQVRTMSAAHWLATEAMPFYLPIPDGSVWRRVYNQGLVISKGNSQEKTFRWPIWVQPLSLDAIRSLITYRDLFLEGVPKPQKLKQLGITCLFESKTIVVDQPPSPTAHAWEHGLKIVDSRAD